MKKIVFAIMTLMSMGFAEADAQDIKDLLKGVASEAIKTAGEKSGNSTVSGVTDVIANLLGNKTVSQKSLVGTWSYTEPAVAFESKNILTQIGGSAASSKIEKTMASYLSKIGFTSGKVSMTFSQDGTGYLTFASKKVPFTYTLSGSDVQIKLGSRSVSSVSKISSQLGKYSTFTMNCKITGSELQLATKSSQLAQFLQKLASAAGKVSSSTAVSAVSGLANKVEGVYLGLKFKK